ncbi:MAG: class I SAM-dependent methyltransferase [Gammaproteobacteria bacterium]|nr:class I SAM-dependent methyltransferase [Gammaproteobacteria bacterium]
MTSVYSPSALPLIAYEQGLRDSALQLAIRWGLRCNNTVSPGTKYSFYLSPERLELRSCFSSQGPVFVDFTAGKMQYRRKYGGGKNQLIAKAVGFKKGNTPSILDATAGFAQDAFVFASLGSQVTLIERSPVIAALLEDGIKRAERHPEIGKLVSNNISLIHTDAIDFMQGLNEINIPDVIFLDPMFPEKNNSALVKKEMRVFRDIVGNDSDADKLLPTALVKAKNRVVVKRPLYANWLNDTKPSVEMKSKKHRFDVYFTLRKL